MAGSVEELDLDFLPPRAAALLRVGNKTTYLVQKTILLFFALFIIWAHFSELHEVTKGTGKIVSSTHIQTISNLEGGIVRDILVRDDQIVSQGQVLVRLDTTIAQSKYMQDLENFYLFLATAERLQAQIDGRPFFPSQELMANAPNITFQEQQRFQSNNQKKLNEINIARKDFEIKAQELKEYKAKLVDAKQQYELALQQIKITKPLAEKKIYSQMDYLKGMRDLAEQEAQLKQLKATVDKQVTAVRQARDRLDQVPIRSRNEELMELRDVQGKLAETRNAQIADRDRVARTEVRSPITGIVRDIKVRTIGGVIQPGESILDIVPLNDMLIVEAQIAPSDIGFIHKGMQATIKVTAFDSSTYGGLDGIVEEISPDTITDKREQTYYRVRLRTRSNVLVKNGIPHSILPGMQAEVDILTGSRSVLTYLIKPFTRALGNAMTEH